MNQSSPSSCVTTEHARLHVGKSSLGGPRVKCDVECFVNLFRESVSAGFDANIQYIPYDASDRRTSRRV